MNTEFETHQTQPEVEKHYAIGAVVKLTGLSAHNIRIWEKRHKAVVANRTDTGRRYYTQPQIDRLILLKKCTETGLQISRIADLDTHHLQETLEAAQADETSKDRNDSISLGIIGSEKLALDVQDIPRTRLMFQQEYPDFSGVHMCKSALDMTPNTLILETPSITTPIVNSIRELIKRASPRFVILIYRFANKISLSALRNSGIRLIKAPLDEQTLENILNSHVSNVLPAPEAPAQLPESDAYPTHIYSINQLDHLADIQTKIDCECPRHLAELLHGLKAFERYSGECINKDDQDAALHAKIQKTTAQTRYQLELLLKEVLSIEGINI